MSGAVDPKRAVTAAGIRRGFVAAQPLALGVLVYGTAFGVLAAEGGLSWLESLLMSALVYSYTAQLAALESLRTSEMLMPVIAAVLVINARYALYGAALRPWLQTAGPLRAYASLFFLGDGNWALSMKAYANGDRDAGFVLGSGVAMFLPWCAGTITGHRLGSLVPDPTALGFDFLLTAFAAAIAVQVVRGRADLWPGVAAGAAALALHALAPGGWYIVGAGIAGAAVAAWRHGR